MLKYKEFREEIKNSIFKEVVIKKSNDLVCEFINNNKGKIKVVSICPIPAVYGGLSHYTVFYEE